MKTIQTDEAKDITKQQIEFERKLIARYLADVLTPDELENIQSGEYKTKLANGKPPVTKLSDMQKRLGHFAQTITDLTRTMPCGHSARYSYQAIGDKDTPHYCLKCLCEIQHKGILESAQIVEEAVQRFQAASKLEARIAELEGERDGARLARKQADEENSRLREALEKYADHSKWGLSTEDGPYHDWWLEDFNGWETAEAALKGEQP